MRARPAGAARSGDPMRGARPRPSRRGAAARAPRPRRPISATHAARVGPHPHAACRRRGGGGGDPRRAVGAAVPLAARSRHRHRPHAGTVRPPLSSAASASTCRSTCCRSRAPISTAPGSPAQVRHGDIYDLPLPRNSLRPRHRPPGAALPRRSGARAIARRRACCGRAAACWSSISRRTIWNSCASSTPIAVSASRHEAMRQWIEAAGLESREAKTWRRSRAAPASSRSRCWLARDGRARWPSPPRAGGGVMTETRASAASCRPDSGLASRSSSSRRRPRRWSRRCGSRSSGSRRWRRTSSR